MINRTFPFVIRGALHLLRRRKLTVLLGFLVWFAATHLVLQRRTDSVVDPTKCAITISDWKRFGFVQNLFESIQTSNPSILCYVWFIADDPFLYKAGGADSKKISEIKKIAIARGILLVTLDRLSQSFENFDIFPQLAFQNELSVDITNNHILPFALKYTLTRLHAGSVVYLDPYVRVLDNLNNILRTKVPNQPIAISRYLSDSETVFGFSLIFLHKKDISLNFLTWWSKPYKWDPSSVFIKMTFDGGWACLEENKNQIAHSSTENESSHSAITQKSLYFNDIPFGFNHFSDGTKISPWMRTLFSDMMSPVLCTEDGILLENTPSVYTRFHFQETVDTKNPFQVSHDHKITFLEWLLKGPSSQAVDMEGKFYFSAFEEQTYNSLSYYPNGLSIQDAMGQGYDSWKSWFFEHAADQEHFSSALFQRVLAANTHHHMNHGQYHKTSLSSSDIGLNIIGWHGGVFGIAKTSGKIYQAANAVGIEANAIEIGPEPVHTYLHPRVLGYPLSRSCSEPVNLVMMNGDHWHHIRKEIPNVIWSHKYNIGYWEWELEVLPEEIMNYAKYYDEIWTPTQFTADSVVNSKAFNGSIVRVLPLPLTGEISARSQRRIKSKALQSLLDEVKNAFVFLTVFDCHSLASRKRKNPEASIGAFLKAFPSDSDVESRYHLIVKSHHASDKDLEEFAEISQNDPRIHFFSDALPDDDHFALQDRADCFVSLHRSEGFGMNILEEMGRGIPVIATNYSGNVDFFPSVNKFIGKCIFAIPYELVTLKENYSTYLAGNHWAEADQNYAADAMVTVARNDCKQKYSTEISNLVVNTFGAKTVGEKLRALLEQIRPSVQEKEMRMNWVSS